MSILGERIDQLMAQVDARKRAQTKNGGVRTGQYVGKREDAVPNDGLPRFRLSDPRDLARLRRLRCEPGCLLGPDEDRFVCLMHGATLGWLS